MKHFSKQTNKWILSTLLVAALGSQYYFSTNSNSLNAVEFSSIASTEVEQLTAQSKVLEKLISNLIEQKGISTADKTTQLTKLAVENGVILGKLKVINDAKIKALSDRIRELTTHMNQTPDKTAQDKENRTRMAALLAQLQADKKKLEEPAKQEEKTQSSVKVITEGTATLTVLGCNECGDKGMTLTGPIAEVMAAAAKLKEKDDTAPVVAAVKKDVTLVETAAERREREKEERDAKREEVKRKKEEIADAKKEKLEDEKTARNEQFAEKAEEIADRCQDDLECKASRLTYLMSRYTDKKKVDTFVVNKAFNQLISKDLQAGLRGEDGTEGKLATLHAIENLMEGTPSEYKILKTRTVDATKAAQIQQAVAVNALYKQADLFAKQNKPTESMQTRQEGFRTQAIFERDATNLYQSMYYGLQQNTEKDQSTIDYIRSNYVPDISKLLTQLTSSTGIVAADSALLTGTQLPATTTTTTTTTPVNRGGRSGTQTVVNSSTNNNSLSNVGFGTPSTNRVINRTGLVK